MMPVNSRIGTQVIWIATLTCTVSERCILLAMGVGRIYGIAMVGSILDDKSAIVPVPFWQFQGSEVGCGCLRIATVSQD